MCGLKVNALKTKVVCSKRTTRRLANYGAWQEEAIQVCAYVTFDTFKRRHILTGTNVRLPRSTITQEKASRL